MSEAQEESNKAVPLSTQNDEQDADPAELEDTAGQSTRNEDTANALQPDELESRRMSELADLKKRLEQDDDHEHHSPAEHVRNTQPWKLHVYIAKHPCPCYLFFLCWFVLCGVIVVAIPGLLAFSTEVPFYIRDNTATEHKDAVIAGKQDASWERQTQQSEELQQETHADVSLQLLFLAKNGKSLAQQTFLEKMDEIE
eukprot:CAMPEP_0197032916 /NCGR_PEP_ID=MMETSP1384-20130603/11460_1 /TAXON_ID=29189 /ORGANISM="Ammonia sp." /LENGTH=197 /DNA_ID=CAMNT_0042462645 /DNA_START=33 /DNA_END=623 /DNA_ORIENTATION=+